MTEAKLIIVSGLSGSGKTIALHALEDLGYYCVDNLPAGLLPDLSKEIAREPELYAKTAVGIDARNKGEALNRLPAYLDTLSQTPLSSQLIFLTADVKTLVKRFSETRRRHPLTDSNTSLQAAIEREKTLLDRLAAKADWVVDTTTMTVHELRRQISKLSKHQEDEMTVILESFAYKRGLPIEADLIFDARCLPNPYWDPALRDFTGLDQPIQDWLANYAEVQDMCQDIHQWLLNWIPRYAKTQRSYLTVGIGCTGGRHRSVYLVETIAARLRKRYPDLIVQHRTINHPK